ncbi:Mur ligase family protein [Methanopyrus kandleri]|uniref:UDP-N-acetylmuramate-alanine ligase n=2 Tax=Methanopyrus kandleri TaxID=2320 RepID=Q8TXB9_METKA|nr:Mur ligase family protein [Methanopyrus kandleri]AAM01969.1 UDP-N-acetylmuramate-alanine ligase [Methanopyrus kandleri AV19]HII70018.1 Mur ligase [Methanopyrus kandleri]
MAELPWSTVLVIGVCGPVCNLAARVLAERGYDVIASDLRDECEFAETLLEYSNVELVLGGHPPEIFERAEVVVPPPSLSRDAKPYRLAEDHGCEIVEVKELLDMLPPTRPVIGVGGTNGKTTTVAMIRHVCEQLGLEAPHHGLPGMQGNVGLLPPLQARLPGDVSVLEIATFGKRGEILEAAELSQVECVCVTNITPDHLNEAGDFLTYARCEAELLEPDTIELAVLNAQDPLVVGAPEVVDFNGDIVYYGLDVEPFDTSEKECWCGGHVEVHEILPWVGPFKCRECGLRSPEPDYLATDVDLSGFRLICPDGEYEVRLPVMGLHNAYNALAAIAVCSEFLGLDVEDVVEALQSFEGVEGRLEVLWDDGERVVILDYGHNPAGVDATLRCVKEAYRERRVCAVIAVASELGPEGDEEILRRAADLADLVVVASYAAYEVMDRVDADNVIAAESATKPFEKKGTLGASREQVLDGLKEALRSDCEVVVLFGEAPLKYREEISEEVERVLGDER